MGAPNVLAFMELLEVSLVFNRKQDVNFKPLSFWSKKVKELENKEQNRKNKCQLYELSESDEGNSSKEGKKKKRKGRITARQRCAKKKTNKIIYDFKAPNLLKKDKPNVIDNKNGSMVRERIVLRRLNHKFMNAEEKMTFNNVAAFGLTSTPGQSEKINVVGGSNFGFLSPIPACEDGAKNGRLVNDDGFDEKVSKESLYVENISGKESFVTPKVSRTRDCDEKPVKRGKCSLINDYKNVWLNEELNAGLNSVSEAHFINESVGIQCGECDNQEYCSEIFGETCVGKNCSIENDLLFEYQSLLRCLLQILSTSSDFLVRSMSYGQYARYNSFSRSRQSLPALKGNTSLEESNLKNDLTERDIQYSLFNSIYHDPFNQTFIRDSFSNVQVRRGVNNFLNFRRSAVKTAFELSRVINTDSCLKQDDRDSSCTILNYPNHNVSDEVLYNHTSKECDDELLRESSFEATSLYMDNTFVQLRAESQQTHGDNSLMNISLVKHCTIGSNQYRSNDTVSSTLEDNTKLYFTAGNDSSLNAQNDSDSIDCSICKTALDNQGKMRTSSQDCVFLHSQYSLGEVTSNAPELRNCRTPAQSELYKPSTSPVTGCITSMANISLNNDSDFTLPIFESTTCQSASVQINSVETVERTERLSVNSGDEVSTENETMLQDVTSFQLKPGKKWAKSASVLKKALNGTLMLDNVSTIKGRNYQTFVEEVLNLQSEISNDTERDVLLSMDIISRRMSNLTLTSRNIGHQTIKIMNQTFQDSERSFRSILSKTVYNHEKSASVIDVKDRGQLGVSDKETKIFSARDLVLMRCDQEEPLHFEEHFNEKTLKRCKKIGEGAFGEVFMCGSNRVFKVIPIEGLDEVNGEPQKKFHEILTEMVVALELSNLRNGENYKTNGFSELRRCWCVIGKYPQYLIDLWNDFDSIGSGSENDSPVMFKSDQMYIILDFANGGKNLEAFVFTSSEQSKSVLFQVVYSLAVAEKALEFEHRDLHWGNILIAPTKGKYFKILYNGEEYKVPTKGVKVTIIDFTLSRISYCGCSIYNDLSVDPTLFISHGDYQFEIYRMMKNEVMNDWSLYRPKTNVFWLHYIVDKMIKMVRYKREHTKIHKTVITNLTELNSRILNYSNSEEFLFKETAS